MWNSIEAVLLLGNHQITTQVMQAVLEHNIPVHLASHLPALASDLMEPFRHFVERSALSMILHREIVAADFSVSPAGACLMEDKARRKYIALLLHSWEVKVTARGQAEPKTWLEHMQEQAQSLKNFIRRGEPFHAFRLR